MAIDVGFDVYNVILFFEYVNSMNLNYKIYLRFNRAMSSTFTLYMVYESDRQKILYCKEEV